MFTLHSTSGNEDRTWRPSLNLHEEDGHLVLIAELPGLTLGHVTLDSDRGDLLVDGDGWNDGDTGHEHYEHLHGRLPLPFAVDPERVATQIDSETLMLRIPLPPPSPEGPFKRQLGELEVG